MDGTFGNPFTNRSMVTTEESFVGRDAQIRDILARVANGGSVSVVGSRRIGKSSLLYHLYLTGERRLRAQGKATFKFVYIDLLDPRYGSQSQFCDEMIRLLGEIPEQAAGAERIVALSRTLDGVKSKGVLPVLLLDELEEITRPEKEFPSTFSISLRSFANDHRIAVITSSRKDLIDLTGPDGLASPLYNIVANVPLAEFCDADVAGFLHRFWSPIRPTPEEQAFLLAYSSRHPLVLQVVSCNLLMNRSLRLDDESLKARIAHELASYFGDGRQRFAKWLREAVPKVLHGIDWTLEEIRKALAAVKPFQGDNRE